MQQIKQLQYLLNTFFPHNFQKSYLIEDEQGFIFDSPGGSVLRLTKFDIEIQGLRPRDYSCSVWRIPQTDFKLLFISEQQDSFFCVDFIDSVMIGQADSANLAFAPPGPLKEFQFSTDENGGSSLLLLFSSQKPKEEWLEYTMGRIRTRQDEHPLSKIIVPLEQQKGIDDYWYKASQYVPEGQGIQEIWDVLEKGCDYLFFPEKSWPGKAKHGSYESHLVSGKFDNTLRDVLQQHWNLLSQPLFENRFRKFVQQSGGEWLAFLFLARYYKLPWADALTEKIAWIFQTYENQALIAKWKFLLFCLENTPVWKRNTGNELHGLNNPAIGSLKRDTGAFSFKSIYRDFSSARNTIWLRNGLKIEIDKEVVSRINAQQDVVYLIHPGREEGIHPGNWFEIIVDGVRINTDLAWSRMTLEVGRDRFKLLFKGRRYQVIMRKRSESKLEIEGQDYTQTAEHILIYKSVDKDKPFYDLKFYDMYGAEIAGNSLYRGHFILDGCAWNSFGQASRWLTLRKEGQKKSTRISLDRSTRVELQPGAWFINIKSEPAYEFRVDKDVPLVKRITQIKAALAPLRLALVLDPEFKGDQLSIQKKFYQDTGSWFEVFDSSVAAQSGASFLFHITRIKENVLEKKMGSRKALLIDYDYLDKYLESFRN